MNTVSNKFHQLAAAPVRPLDWELGISWTKTLAQNVNWFTLDQSELDDVDLLADNDQNPVMLWDAYDYQMSRDRVIDMSVERSVKFPYNIQSAVLDVSLNNYDGLYTYGNANSSIASYILPSRPIRAYLGFNGGGLTPVFVGLTEAIPEYSGQVNEKAQLTALDFLAAIGDMSLNEMIMMKDARTDEVIEVILQQFGLDNTMYSLAQGMNTIPFVYFESGKNAGNALKELVQAENGAMWIDEQGMIRFEPRTGSSVATVMSLDEDNIVSIDPSEAADIVNYITVESDVRTVRSFQPIFTGDNANGYDSAAKDDAYRIPANGSKEIWLSLEDPCWSATALVFNGPASSSNFTALKASTGTRVTSGVTVSNDYLFADAYRVTVNNTNNFAISLDYIQLWGEPAKIVGESPTIKYEAYDEDSVEAFGRKELSITDNDCFGSYENVDNYASQILLRYKDYSSVIKVSVKGDPSVQMHDGVSIDYNEYTGIWEVIGIKHKLTDAKLETILELKRLSTTTNPFILDVSELDGPDVII